MELEPKKIFNPKGNDEINERTIIKGNTTGLFQLNATKYSWAKSMYSVMVGNFWIPEKVSGLSDDAIQFDKLNENEKKAYKGILSFLIFLDSIQTVNLPNFNDYITAPEVNLILSIQAYQECLTEECEFLTEKGWKKLTEYKKGDKVLQYNNDGTTEFVNPIEYISYDYEGDIHCFSGRYIEQMVTPNHRIPTIKDKKKNEDINIIYAKDLKEGQQSFGFLATGEKKGIKKELSYYERFLIALQADGTIYKEYINSEGKIVYKNRNGKRGTIQCIFSFSKEKKIKRLKEILDNLKFEYKTSIEKERIDKNIKKRTTFRIRVPKDKIITKNFKEWVNLEDYDSEYYKDFIKEVSHWDASDRGNKNIYYYTSSKENSEIISAISSLAGYKTLITKKVDNRKESYKDIYYVNISNSKKMSRGTVTKSIKKYKGKVSCFTVESGMFLVKQNGKISVTGNCIHSQSYATILETVVDAKGRDEIYYFWRDDKHLLKRNEFIGKIYQDFIDKPNDKNFFKGIIGNFLLESIYFYNGFAFFHTLADQGKMLATNRMITYIKKDELTHVTIFANILKEIKNEFPEMYDEKLIKDMMDVAVKQEIEWSKYILNNSVIGMNDDNIEKYTKWLANQRLSMLNISPLYPSFTENPYTHITRMEDNNSEKGNFFESTVTNYTQSSSMQGKWDF